MHPHAGVGLVVIGRNEGERLARCLEALPSGVPVVYVDSGSVDDSLARAQSRGVPALSLDAARPFTASRARNEGWRYLASRHPDLVMIQFVDGDCELVPGFLDDAAALMRSREDVAAVCGWTREVHAAATVYNTVCDVEWRSGSVGDTRAFGGNVLIRIAALASAGGFDETVIAAEDDELGIRLRAGGGRIVRIDRVSTLHDAAMTEFRQWWTRSKRCGHAYAQLADMHGAPPERYFVREHRRALLWGLGLPAAATGLALPSFGASLWLLAAYPLQAWRTFRGARRRGFTGRESVIWGLSCTMGKVPQAVGALKYQVDRLKHRTPTIIEHKGPSASRATPPPSSPSGPASPAATATATPTTTEDERHP